jgi:hypothetical protein
VLTALHASNYLIYYLNYAPLKPYLSASRTTISKAL